MDTIFEQIAGAIRDPWFVVDAERTVQHHNEAFASLCRGAGDLTGRRCFDLLELDACKDDCIALAAIRSGQPVRVDQVPGCVAESGRAVTLAASASPVVGLGPMAVGSLVVYRDISEDARVQQRYEALLEEESDLREELEEQLRRRTAQLLEVGDELNELELQLAALRKGVEEPDG